MGTESVTRALAAFVASREACASEAAVELARTAVLDTVGVALAGAAEPAVGLLRAEVAADGGPCTLIGGGRAAPDRAALINGTAAHALDFDDVDDLLIGHPSTVLVPALLAVAEQAGASGPRLVGAYWRGLVVMRALAAGLDIESHYGRGWHSTAVLGVVGAAAGAATVLGLDAERAQHALGIAASRAAGSRRNFGSMTKPLHAGVAAADGVTAASLARRGFTSGQDVFDGTQGFVALYSGGESPSEPDLANRAERVTSTLHDGGPAALNVKLHPCCYATHAAADAALDLAAGGLDASEVDSVHVAVPAGALQPLIDTTPETGLEGKFSMAYVVAAGLLDGRLGLASFTDAAVARPDVRALASRVTADETLLTPAKGSLFQAEVTARTAAGTTRGVRCDAPRGHVDHPATEGDVLAKFQDCVAFSGVSADPSLASRLRGLPEAPTAEGLSTVSSTLRTRT